MTLAALHSTLLHYINDEVDQKNTYLANDFNAPVKY